MNEIKFKLKELKPQQRLICTKVSENYKYHLTLNKEYKVEFVNFKDKRIIVKSDHSHFVSIPKRCFSNSIKCDRKSKLEQLIFISDL